MLDDPIVQLSGIVVLAFSVTWLGERLRVPVILPLLLTGFLIGPVLGLANPDEIFGDLLAPTVSIAVGLILFEGGLSLRLREMEGQQRVLWLLVTVGVLITWVIGAVVTALFTDLSIRMSILTGSILVVSGPTVIGPLLAQVRPHRSVASILKWESIFIDPIGALLAVITFEAILLGGAADASPGGVLANMVEFVFVGVLVGSAVAYGASIALRRHWVPEHLVPLFGLSIALFAFMIADLLTDESGLLACTVLGFALANQRQLRTDQISHFSEVVRQLLIGVLFIVLSARITREQLGIDLPAAAALILTLVVVARPTAVWLSTIRSRLDWHQRVLLGGVAPRGIVAASVASVFSLELEEGGVAGAEELTPLVFAVIVGTVLIYGVGMGPLARRLGLAEKHQEGCLILGAGRVERAIADALADAGVAVVMATTNRQDHLDARTAGRRAYYGNVLARDVDLDLDLAGIGRLLALTPNDDVNTLAATRFAATFGGAETYQLPARSRGSDIDSHPADEYGGRQLFGMGWNYSAIDDFLDWGGEVRRIKVGSDPSIAQAQLQSREILKILFVVKANNRVQVITAGSQEPPRDTATGDTVIALVDTRSAIGH
ncbi:MAG: cation:proton antiporter [Acidimicrobiia bacterium]|nr:cation:proton antiporter [Acidimicrobiia bacterium]